MRVVVLADLNEFHGTSAERDELLAALARNCTCQPDADGHTKACPAHDLLHDQRILDRLIFDRRIRGRLLAEEWYPSRNVA